MVAVVLLLMVFVEGFVCMWVVVRMRSLVSELDMLKKISETNGTAIAGLVSGMSSDSLPTPDCHESVLDDSESHDVTFEDVAKVAPQVTEDDLKHAQALLDMLSKQQ